MRIGMILERDFPITPPDIRVEKEIGSLLQAGHEVELLSLKMSPRPTFEHRDDLNITRVPIPMLCIRDWRPALVKDHFQSNQSPWVAAIGEFIRKRSIDVLHVHDLPLVWTATAAAKKASVPVVFDMHEIYPPMVRFMRWPQKGAWDPGPWVAAYEKECLKGVDKVIVVVEESRRRLLSLGVLREKIVVVQNTETLERMNSHPGPGLSFQNQWFPNRKGKFIVTYVGTFGEIRGLELLIEAMHLLRDTLPDLHLLLVGGEYNQPQLEDLALKLDLKNRMTITGWVPFEAIGPLIETSDICTVPHIKNPFTDATIPHKLFQYMLMGKPVVVSDAKPLKRIVKECSCGVVFQNGDTDSLAEALLKLYRNPDLMKKTGDNGRRAALQNYHWKKDEEKLLDLYRQLIIS